VLWLLILASSVSIMSTDLYAPSLPDLPRLLGTNPQAVKLTISLNTLAFGLAQLFLGPISDRFGRRPIMLVGLTGFTLFSLACALASTIGQLIAFRIFQGIFACVEAVVGLAIVRDLFADADQVRALAIWGMAIALAPALGPIAGGYVHISLGWQANFWILFLLGAGILALFWRRLPESATPDASALEPAVFLRNYWTLLGNRQFMSNVLLLGTSLGVIFAFITSGPFILVHQFRVATEHYGFFQAAIVTAFFLGSLVTTRLANRTGLRQLLNAGAAIAALGALSLPALHLLGWIGPVTLTSAIALTAAGMGPIFAIAPSFALQQAGPLVGAGSAVIGAGEMILSGLASGMVTALHDGTALPLVLTTLVLFGVAVLAWIAGSTKAARPDGTSIENGESSKTH